MSSENINILIGAGQLLFAILVFLNIDKEYVKRRIPSVRIRSVAIYVFTIGGLVFSGYGFYLANRHPKMVEKIVEKPVERIVQKECLTPAPAKPQPKETTPKETKPSVSTSGNDSPAVGSITQGQGSALSFNQKGGITAGTIIGAVATPPRVLSSEQVAALKAAVAGYQAKVLVYVQRKR